MFLPEFNNLIRRTPLLELERNIFGKAENFQTGRSYKIRGVVRYLQSLPSGAMENGIATVSAGNLGQALAKTAAILHVPCQIYIPDSTPNIKKQKILSFGAELVERPFQDIWKMVCEKSIESDKYFLHPCFSEELHRGYGSMAEEILSDLPEADAFVIPYGLGGLLCGVAETLKARNCVAKIYACEMEYSAPLTRAFHGEKGKSEFRRSSFVDAIGTPAVVPAIFAKVSELVDDSILVNESEAISAFKALYDYGLVVEGAAAAAFAAALKLSSSQPKLKIVCLLSGGNIEQEKVAQLLSTNL